MCVQWGIKEHYWVRRINGRNVVGVTCKSCQKAKREEAVSARTLVYATILSLPEHTDTHTIENGMEYMRVQRAEKNAGGGKKTRKRKND